MKKVRTVAIATLGFLAVSAIVGSLPLILDPHGTPWGFMSQSMLRFSPFHSYLIPGIILCLANGVPSLLVLTVTIRRRPGYSWWVALQGCILTGWMVVEVIMLRVLSWPQYLYLGTGLVLIASGLMMTRKPDPASLTG